jgi:hypothetical protein
MADPVFLLPQDAPTMLVLIIPLFLFVEGIAIVLLAKSSRVRSVGFIPTWFLVTLLTWAGFMKGLDLFQQPPDPNALITVSYYPSASFPIVAVGEILIAIVETGAIWLMLRILLFAQQTAEPPTLARSLYYSVVANSASLCGGLIATYVLLQFAPGLPH